MGKSPTPWEEKEGKGFWRGRDSRQERLDLVVMSRKHPDDIDAKMTRMFFFKHDQEKFGDLVQNIPFFDFFKVFFNVDQPLTLSRVSMGKLSLDNHNPIPLDWNVPCSIINDQDRRFGQFHLSFFNSTFYAFLFLSPHKMIAFQ